MNSCPHCGMLHQTTCPRIKAIEYNQDGVTVKRIEFHTPLPLVTGPSTVNIRMPDAPSSVSGAAANLAKLNSIASG